MTKQVNRIVGITAQCSNRAAPKSVTLRRGGEDLLLVVGADSVILHTSEARFLGAVLREFATPADPVYPVFTAREDRNVFISAPTWDFEPVPSGNMFGP